MRVRRVAIQVLPGIPPPGLTVEGLAPGANLIVGPNASGKSSLVRALRLALYGEERAAGPCLVEVDAELADGRRVHVSRAGAQREWRHEGAPLAPPPLPAHRLLGCYLLQLEDLVAVDTPTEEAIREWLARELAGGYDLRALRAGDGPFALPSRIALGPRRSLEEATTELRQAEHAERALHHDAERLDALRAEREQATAAQATLARVEAARELLEARAARQALEQQLAAFPAGMERLRGDEAERLERIERRRGELEQTLAAARSAHRQAEAKLAAAALGDTPPSAGELEAIAATQRALERDEEHLEQARQALARAEAGLASASETLGAPVPSAAPVPTPAAVHEAEEALERVRELAARTAALDEALRHEPADGPAEPAAALRHAYAAAARVAAAPIVPGEAGWAVALAAATVAVAAGTTALVLDPLWWWLALPAAAAGGGLGWLAWHGRRARSALERALERCPTLCVSAASASDETLTHIQEALARAEELERATARRREIARALEATSRELADAREAARALAERFGFDPLRLDGALARFLKLLAEHDAARQAKATAAAELEAAQRRVEERRRQLAAELARLGQAVTGTARDAATLGQAVAALTARASAATEALRERAAAAARMEEMQVQLAALAEEAARLYADAGLAAGERARLEERLRRLAQWRALVGDHQRAIGAEALARQRLTDAPELRALAESGDRTRLEQLAAAVREQAGRADGLSQQIGSIEERIRRAGAERPLERAHARWRSALEALADEREAAFDAVAGQVLLDEVERSYEHDARPAVLRQAAEWLARFTHGRYVLEAGRDGVTVRDTERGERQRLAELSTGTRAQLLIALRAAFAAEAERGREPLPLILDEALTTTDPDRFRAVVEALAALANGQGRQVVYLTAQPADVAMWRAVDPQCRVIELAAAQRASQAAAAGALAVAPPAAPPSPAGLTAAAYAEQLRVPALDPWADPGSIHLFHLLGDELETLHHLLSMGLERLGPLEAHLGAGAGGIAPALRDALRARARAARAWVTAWREGRGRPVDRAALMQCEAITERFQEPVAALSERLGGDAGALLAALGRGEVPRFRTAAREALAQWLRERGHLPLGEPLTAGELQARVAAALAEGGAADAETLELARRLAARLAAGVAAAHTGARRESAA